MCNQRWAVSRYIVSRYVFRYIRVSVNVFIDTFDSEYLDTVFRYILAVFKYMYLDTFSDTLKKWFQIDLILSYVIKMALGLMLWTGEVACTRIQPPGRPQSMISY